MYEPRIDSPWEIEGEDEETAWRREEARAEYRQSMEDQRNGKCPK
jgi:hypothetical protein